MTTKIITTSPTKPPRIIIYGDHKIGKSSFGAKMPSPIFVQTEDGLESLGVQAFERATNFDSVIEQLNFLGTEKHDYKTVVLDSLDWTEKLIWEEVCAKNNWTQIGEGAYGAGYKIALNYWRDVLGALDFLSNTRKMAVCLIAHAKVTKFEDPEKENYDRWNLDLHEKSSKMLCEWADIIGFANLKTIVSTKKEDFGTVTKAKSTGERQICLNGKAAYEAGNRYGLPDTLPLEWSALAAGIGAYFAAQAANPAGNLAAIKAAHEEAKAKRAEEKQISTKVEIEAAKASIENTNV